MPYIVLITSALAGGLAVHFWGMRNETRTSLLLSFSGAYLFTLCVLNLLPEVFSGSREDDLRMGLLLLSGLLLQVLLEFLSGGIEHGHIHAPGEERAFPFALYLALCAHAYTEALPLGAGGLQEGVGRTLLAGIAVHKFPEAFVLMTFLLPYSLPAGRRFFLLLLFAAMAPMGMLTLQFTPVSAVPSRLLLALAAGIFIHVSTTILMESSENHRFNLYRFLTILFGVGAGIGTVVI